MFTKRKCYSSVLKDVNRSKIKDRPDLYVCAVIRAICRHFNKGGQSN